MDAAGRRSRIDLYTPGETAIREAVIATEAMGADPRLTDAVVMLGKAKDSVADFVDGIPRRERTQFGWLIERYVNSELLYWCGRSAEDFRPSHADAVRFGRQEDASIVLAWLCGGNGRAVEHGWG